ncbi:MAG TPA: glycoside-pentoside-hexuronide (GPH):cation symporter [Thermoclostridium sp.]|nr:glycoside-pentoside-hexuronide (GPH):cation symporter [Thermoclostridium sp.]
MSKKESLKVETATTYYQGKEAVLRKTAFASGEIVYNFPWMVVSSYLMFFLTDIALVPAAIVSVLFLAVRLFDAINDPLIGSLADRTKTKMGRYRPWMLAGAIVLLPSVVLLFWAHPDWSQTARTWYAIILYIVAVIGATMWNIPYGGLNAVITPYSEERASFSSYRISVSSLACALSSYLFINLAIKFSGADGSDSVRGYLLAALVISVLAVPFVFTSIGGTKEIIQAPPNQKYEFKKVFKTITKNPPLLKVIIGFFIFGFMAYGRMSAAMYYFSYNWGDATLMGTFNLINGLVTGVAAFFAYYLIKLMKSKRNAILLSYAVMGGINAFVYTLSPDTASPTFVIMMMVLAGVFNGLVTSIIYSMVPDTVEYGQWKTGIRADGFIYSSTSFMLKAGGAISPALLGALLAKVNYAPNIQQNVQSLKVMNFMTNMMPALLCVLGFIVFWFYKLDGKAHEKIIKDLEERGEFTTK